MNTKKKYLYLFLFIIFYSIFNIIRVGNGFNLAGVATTKEVSSYLAKKAHFNTFGGNDDYK